MNLDFNKLLFTAKGGYLAVSKDSIHLGGGIWLRSLIRPEWGTGRKRVSDHMLRFLPQDMNGMFVDFAVEFQPHMLKFVTNSGEISLYFSDCKTLCVKCDNMKLVLEHDYDDALAVNIEANRNDFSAYYPLTYHTLRLMMEKGGYEYAAQYKRLFLDCDCHFCIEAFREDISYSSAFSFGHQETGIEAAKSDFDSFYASFGKTNYHTFAAAYTLWSGTYTPAGNIKRFCNGATKNSINLVFSWDNCFIAMGVAKADPALAKNNFLAFFDHQKADGHFCDAYNPAIKVSWFTKPPVHGYFYQKLQEKYVVFTEEETLLIYEGLKKQTEAWFRNTNHMGLLYYKHGFDSGWDNATCFDKKQPVVSPDLNAYMAAQLYTISDIALLLHKDSEHNIYKSRAENHVKLMLEHIWNGKEFLCVDGDGVKFETTSLIKMIPIILSKHLPDDVLSAMTRTLFERGFFLTPYSLATESLSSPLYDHRKGDSLKPNAYWRGPVWAPSTYLIYSGLMDGGFTDEADMIARRYCDLIEQGGGGLNENYDALTGVGYDDTQYGWTAAVYLCLCCGR